MVALLSVVFLPLAVLSAVDGSKVVAKVNGVSIRAADLEFAAIQQGLVDTERATTDPALVERLIDRQLIRGFLKSRKIEAPADELESQIVRAEAVIKKGGDDPKELLKKLGYTPDRLKSELGLTLAWQVYVRKSVTATQMKDYFEKHKNEFDGTQLRASQIFLKLPRNATQAEIAEVQKKMAEIRRQIVDDNLSFADAAKKYSDAPTREAGGDVGLFRWQGKLPASVSQAAFGLKVNDISEPVISPFGIHLIKVTERHPGDFSIEDVRPILVDRLSQQLWNQTVEAERAKAKIERDLVK